MNVESWLVWGFAATVVLTTLMSSSHGIGLTRVSLPYLLGLVFTPKRERAKLVGSILHLFNGWGFALVYVAFFHQWGGPALWKGAAIGAAHGAFVLAVLMPAMPALHPRMASETQGPDVLRPLEPPGFLALHYGRATGIAIFLSHIVFGAILGLFYRA